jgi:hypothetical protein
MEETEPMAVAEAAADLVIPGTQRTAERAALEVAVVRAGKTIAGAAATLAAVATVVSAVEAGPAQEDKFPAARLTAALLAETPPASMAEPSSAMVAISLYITAPLLSIRLSEDVALLRLTTLLEIQAVNAVELFLQFTERSIFTTPRSQRTRASHFQKMF